MGMKAMANKSHGAAELFNPLTMYLCIYVCMYVSPFKIPDNTF
jgi:hypothetical protein